MVNFDLTPLFRTTVGFDRLMDMVENGLAAAKTETGYPPYNIEKIGEDRYRVTLAVAGFVLEYLVWTVGFGAVALTRFRQGRGRTGEAKIGRAHV